jgi:hypothetical protein
MRSGRTIALAMGRMIRAGLRAALPAQERIGLPGAAKTVALWQQGAALRGAGIVALRAACQRRLRPGACCRADALPLRRPWRALQLGASGPWQQARQQRAAVTSKNSGGPLLWRRGISGAPQ